MKILKPNTGKDVVPIIKQHIYVKATDTKQISFLKEIKIDLGQHTWEWISFRSDLYVDVSEINDRYCSFDHAINRSVNDVYCTVYEFESIEEMINNWSEIKYVDNITTVYKSKEQ